MTSRRNPRSKFFFKRNRRDGGETRISYIKKNILYTLDVHVISEDNELGIIVTLLLVTRISILPLGKILRSPSESMQLNSLRNRSNPTTVTVAAVRETKQKNILKKNSEQRHARKDLARMFHLKKKNARGRRYVRRFMYFYCYLVWDNDHTVKH